MIMIGRKKMILDLVVCPLLVGCFSQQESEEIADDRNEVAVAYVINDSLTMANYADYRGYSPEKGLVSTPEMAVQIAEVVLNAIYGKPQIDEQKPFFVNLDNGVWLIEGRMDADPDVKGGVAYIEIRKSNGEIIKVLHGK